MSERSSLLELEVYFYQQKCVCQKTFLSFYIDSKARQSEKGKIRDGRDEIKKPVTRKMVNYVVWSTSSTLSFIRVNYITLWMEFSRFFDIKWKWFSFHLNERLEERFESSQVGEREENIGNTSKQLHGKVIKTNKSRKIFSFYFSRFHLFSQRKREEEKSMERKKKKVSLRRRFSFLGRHGNQIPEAINR